MTDQTGGIVQVVDILDTRQHELAGMVDICPRKIEALGAPKEAAQGMLDELRGKA